MDMVQCNPKFRNSLKTYKEAKQLFPYGTQLFSRRPELGPFGQAPVYFEKAKHGHFWDVDGNEFIDTALAFGPISLGYCYDIVDNAVKKQIDKGFLGSINSPVEIELANLICEIVPCAEMIKFCKGGGDADAVAIRIARGYTGKDIVLFCGYHGWCDWYLAANLNSESNLNQHLRPGISAKGVPSQLAGTCIPFEYNNLDNLKKMLEQNKGKVACIIMEPTRFKKPGKGYLEGVRQLADEHKCVLIFDEVVTGFRLAAGGAQEYFGVTPDMATYAKAVANGYALSVVAGKRDIMSSQGDNFISSTYWSDATAMAAGIATLNEIRTKPVIQTIDRLGRRLMVGLEELGRKHKVNIKIAGHGCDFAVSFDYGNDSGKILTLYMQEMVARGIYVSGVVYTCFTHTDKDVDSVLAAADETFSIIKKALDANDVDTMLKCPVRQVGFRRLV